MGTMKPGNFHYGRSFGGPAWIEAHCPCPKEACGLVMTPDPGCADHPFARMKTIRVSHPADQCPGAKMLNQAVAAGRMADPFPSREDPA